MGHERLPDDLDGQYRLKDQPCAEWGNKKGSHRSSSSSWRAVSSTSSMPSSSNTSSRSSSTVTARPGAAGPSVSSSCALGGEGSRRTARATSRGSDRSNLVRFGGSGLGGLKDQYRRQTKAGQRYTHCSLEQVQDDWSVICKVCTTSRIQDSQLDICRIVFVVYVPGNDRHCFVNLVRTVDQACVNELDCSGQMSTDAEGKRAHHMGCRREPK